jgi:hypothetical protein
MNRSGRRDSKGPRKTSVVLLIAAFTLLGAGGAFAASGVTSLLTTSGESSVGSDPNATPLGVQSAAVNSDDDDDGNGSGSGNGKKDDDDGGDAGVAGVAGEGPPPPGDIPTPPGGGDVLPESGSSPPGTAGVASTGGPNIQPAAQTSAGDSGDSGDGGKIPFTGFAAIPLLLIGVAFLATGFVLRRRFSAEEPAGPAGA